MPEAPVSIFQPNVEFPREGGCYLRQEDGSLIPDPTEPAPAPAPAPEPSPAP